MFSNANIFNLISGVIVRLLQIFSIGHLKGICELKGGFLDFDVSRHDAEQNGITQQPYIRGGGAKVYIF